MSKHLPPVPPAARSHKGTGETRHLNPKDRAGQAQGPKNFAEQDRHGNIAQNTRNQGYQQDR